METVNRKKEETDIWKQQKSILFEGKTFEIEMCGLNVERSMEDRDVYMKINTETNIEYTTWIKGEDAIELGQLFNKTWHIRITIEYDKPSKNTYL